MIFLARNKNFPQLNHTTVVYYLIKQKLVRNYFGRGCLEKPDATAISPRLEEQCFNYMVSSVKASKKVIQATKHFFKVL